MRPRHLGGRGQLDAGAIFEHRRLEVHRRAVVRLLPVPAGLERSGKVVDRLTADHVQVPRGFNAADGHRQLHELAQAGLLVVARRGAAAVGPGVEVRQLHAQNRRLKLIQARVVAHVLIRDLVPRAVEAQHADAVGECAVARGDRAAITEATKVLGREEAERRERAKRAGAPGCRQRARGLGGVLDDRNAERLDLRDRGDVSEQVHGDHGLRARRQRNADRLGRDAHRLGVDVAEDRTRTGGRDRLGAGVERERGHDDLVARADAERAQPDGQRIGPVRHPDRVLGRAVAGELALEGLDLGTENELAAVDHARDRGIDLGAQRDEGRGGIEEGYRHWTGQGRTWPPPGRSLTAQLGCDHAGRG
jgi:hypothetical protein